MNVLLRSKRIVLLYALQNTRAVANSICRIVPVVGFEFIGKSGQTFDGNVNNHAIKVQQFFD